MAFSLGDAFKIGSALLGYKSSKESEQTLSKEARTWNKYNRQVDLLLLDKLIDQQKRQRLLLADRQELEKERAKRLAEGGTIDESRAARLEAEAAMEHGFGLEEVNAAWMTALRERDDLYERLGIDTAQQNMQEQAIAAQLGIQGFDSAVLAHKYGYGAAELKRRQLMREEAAGLIPRGQAEVKLQEWRQSRLTMTGPDGRPLSMVEKLGTIGVQQRMARVQRAVGVGRLAEEATRAKGAVGSQQAARGIGVGSFQFTERARIEREHSRQRAELEAQTDVALAGATEAGIKAKAALGVLGAERARVTGATGRVGEAVEEARAARTRGVGRAEARYAGGIEESARAALGAREKMTEAAGKRHEADRIRSDAIDVNLAHKIALWQRKTVPNLPLGGGGGSSRSAVGLLLQVGAEIID